MPRASRAFTLIEVLICILILAILTVLLFGSMKTLLATSRTTACIANLRSLSSAFAGFASDNRNCLPPAYYAGRSWVTHIWAYLDQGEYHVNGSKRVGPTYCAATTKTGLGIYKRDRATWRTDFCANSNVLSANQSRNTLASTPPRLVLLFDGGGGAFGSAYQGDVRASRRHNEKFNALFMDGHVETLNTFTNAHLNDWKKP